ncbi:hypothetical protein COT78_00555 [Candidatus Berkelbacteria bacterium CG10_big_fil_rev_8_21_14_0_10_43_13]|uniref:Disulfide oxidoreductase n=1 Tax=Candidatus Berkelbacteria bacterium CG10_big_fil_rev_8_21_14_0_10_43_13 TaxID=1974514 RepID=A0A2H0W7A9_9BACT|nr:MAG: hypothetical protein COT78_00555 [Candidatus Berkelbacteria bacterium CG10_big_fil_rev_8_21_14_0_10_43_13]
MKYTAKTLLKDIYKKKDGEKILGDNGVPCVSCPMAAMELDKLEIGQICDIYGLDLEKVLKDLNK